MLSTRRLARLWPLLALAGLAPAQHTPEDALRTLQAGNERFAAGRSVPQPVGEGVRRTLARGQSPLAVVVTCADSRVPPEHLFNAGLGELVVVRVAGHVQSAETIATIEQAVEHLNVPLCIVLGHEHCDVVAAAISQTGSGGPSRQRSQALVQLLEHLEPAVRKARALDLGGKDLQGACEEEHAHATVQECMRRSELLRRFASVGKFRMVAARYHLDGRVEWLPNRPLPRDPAADEQAPLGAVPAGLPPHVALRMLQSGHRRFLGDSRPSADLTASRREALGTGQQPLAIVLTDSDSRVSPEHVFDAGLGELYVVRVGGNTLTDDTLASIEFAAGELGASLLVVMGHDRCEPIAAAIEPPERQQLTANQRALLLRLEPSVTAARHQPGRSVLEGASQANVLRTLHEARSRSALLRTLEDQGRLAMLASYYDVASGDLQWLKEPEAVATHAKPSHDASKGHGHGAHDQGEETVHATEHGVAQGHESPGGHDAHGDAHAAGDHAAASHGADIPPVLDWSQLSAPFGESKPMHGAGGDDADPHGAHAPHTPADHAAAGAAPEHAAHGKPHGDHGPVGSENHPMAHLSQWTDPVVVVGMIGILSLLLAAVMAMKSR